MALQQAQAPIDKAIANALIEATPESWKAAVLLLRFNERGGGRESITHEISSPEGHRDVIQVTEQLMEESAKLSDVFRKHGRPLASATYAVELEMSGNWKWRAEYGTERSNNALLADAFSLLRCACGAAKRGR